MKRKYKQERNKKISEDVDEYRKMGFKVIEAIDLTAEKWFMSSDTIRMIYYQKGYYKIDYTRECQE